ncbi:MAG: hypothetical protein H6719_38460, partial [Sandaracinaceae bacterium]|nr:hypothetical protein [Sandaracinaceae bacterium]
MSRIHVTDEYFPLVYVIAADADTEAWAAAMDQIEAIYRRREPFVHLSDTSAVRSVPSPKLRKLLADRALDMRPLVKEYSLGDARVVTSNLVRGAMTAISWIYTHPAPLKHFGTLGEGIDWCVEQLEQADVRVPEKV